MSREQLLAAVGRLRGRRLVVIGDVITDRYQFGVPVRVSREAPVLVLEHGGEAAIPGGAANAASNARALGGVVTLLGVVGDDAEAELLRGQLRTLGIDADGLVVEAGRTTTSKTRVFAGTKLRGQQVVRLDRHSRAPLQDSTRRRLARQAEAALAGADALLVSDYGYAAVEPVLTNRLIAAARRRGLPVVVDTQVDPAAYRRASVLTPNLAELEAWAGKRLEAETEVAAAAAALARKSGAAAVLCTQGAAGMLLVAGAAQWRLPVAREVEVSDVAGAGDTVAATVSLGLAAGLELWQAAQLANCAASVVVRKLGAATCSPAELRAVVRRADAAAVGS